MLRSSSPMKASKSLYVVLVILYLDYGTHSLHRTQADKLQTVIKAAKVEEVEPIWSTLFAKVCEHVKKQFENA